jgi:hypothetical protein
MKKIKIEVTRQDIDKGEKGSCDNCAVARAVNRHIDGLGGVESDGTIWYYNEGIHEIPTSKKVARFIDRFDEGKDVKPFTFTLNAPDDILL